MDSSLRPWIIPETVAALIVAIIFFIAAKYSSGEGKDLELMEKLVLILPLIVVPIVFLTYVLPGSQTWWWLARACVSSFLAISIGSGRLISGFGSGPRGQDAAFILAITLGWLLLSVATTLCGTMILAHNNPSFSTWFRAHRLAGYFLAALSTLPVGFVLGFILTTVTAIFLGIWSFFSTLRNR